jgi:hypothetical protein
MQKHGVIALFSELRTLLIIMDCSGRPSGWHFHLHGCIGRVRLDEIRIEERSLIVIMFATILSELLHMNARTSAFCRSVTPTVKTFRRNTLRGRLSGKPEGDFTNPRLHLSDSTWCQNSVPGFNSLPWSCQLPSASTDPGDSWIVDTAKAPLHINSLTALRTKNTAHARNASAHKCGFVVRLHEIRYRGCRARQSVRLGQHQQSMA